MSNNPIIVRPGQIDLRLCETRLTDFPNTGTFISIEPVSARSVFQEGQRGSDTSVRMAGTGFRVAITAVQHTPSDIWMAKTMRYLEFNNVFASLTINGANGRKYVSGSMSGEADPTREFAGDSSPTVVYTWTGSFQIITVGDFQVAPVATAAQINDFS